MAATKTPGATTRKRKAAGGQTNAAVAPPAPLPLQQPQKMMLKFFGGNKAKSAKKGSKRGKNSPDSGYEDGAQDQGADDPDEDYVPEGKKAKAKAKAKAPAPARVTLNHPLRKTPNNAPPLWQAPTARPVQPAPVPEHAETDRSLLDNLEEEVLTFAQLIQSSDEIQMELPSMAKPHPDHTDDPEQVIDLPYTSKMLFHSYIHCYDQGDWNTCDLIADNWIREFQRVDDSKSKIWEKNMAKKFDRHSARPHDDNGNPSLDSLVTRFDPDRLRELYEYTDEECGARLLWADAMALCGSRVEDKLATSNKDEWHPELVWNVMMTSLRCVRARRTLKIEEKDPAEWCKRYHEHGKHGFMCYRDLEREQKMRADQEVARKKKQAKKVQDPQSNEMDMAELMEMELAKAFENEAEDGENAGPPPKRVKFTNGDGDGDSDSTMLSKEE